MEGFLRNGLVDQKTIIRMLGSSVMWYDGHHLRINFSRAFRSYRRRRLRSPGSPPMLESMSYRRAHQSDGFGLMCLVPLGCSSVMMNSITGMVPR